MMTEFERFIKYFSYCCFGGISIILKDLSNFSRSDVVFDKNHKTLRIRTIKSHLDSLVNRRLFDIDITKPEEIVTEEIVDFHDLKHYTNYLWWKEDLFIIGIDLKRNEVKQCWIVPTPYLKILNDQCRDIIIDQSFHWLIYYEFIRDERRFKNGFISDMIIEEFSKLNILDENFFYRLKLYLSEIKKYSFHLIEPVLNKGFVLRKI